MKIDILEFSVDSLQTYGLLMTFL